MSDLNYNISISATAEFDALRELEQTLQRQIVQARVLGDAYDLLEQKLARTRSRLDDIPANSNAAPAAVDGETASNGGAAAPPYQRVSVVSPVQIPQPVPPIPAALPDAAVTALLDSFAEYHAATLAALDQLHALVASKSAELKQYVDARVADVANP